MLVIRMGYMDLMSKVENVDLIGKMIRDYMAGADGNVQNVFDLEDAFARTIWMDACVKRIKENPDSARLIEERYMGPEYNLDELEATRRFVWVHLCQNDDPQGFCTPFLQGQA